MPYFIERFTITFWDVIIENELVWSEHMSIMCNEIERVYKLVFERRHKKHDLIINIPPGTSKTTICSIMATCWAFANMPSINSYYKFCGRCCNKHSGQNKVDIEFR